MKKNIIKIIKDWHLRICIAILLFISIFTFALSFMLEDTMQFIPWWFALLYGWSGLIVSLTLSEIWYKDKK